MLRRNLACLATFLFVASAFAQGNSADLDQHVSGDPEVEDVLGSSSASGNSPYIIDGESASNIENSKPKGEDYIFNHGVKEVSGDISPKKQFEDFGYTVPGTFEKQESYIDLDKKKMSRGFSKNSTGGINISFIKNSFDYQSQNDIINQTIGSGYKSVKGGSLLVRHDSYIFKTDFLNGYWALGAGIGYNSGRGVFVDGTRSDTTINLWEAPIDLGLGIEIPLYSWFKISGTGGASALGLLQNRSDFQRGEKGKRKIQYSPGYFANAQFKISLTGFSEETAYDLFASSEITNLFLNLEVRHQNYENFKDDIKISGTSFGIGFTFEYL